MAIIRWAGVGVVIAMIMILSILAAIIYAPVTLFSKRGRLCPHGENEFNCPQCAEAA